MRYYEKTKWEVDTSFSSIISGPYEQLNEIVKKSISEDKEDLLMTSVERLRNEGCHIPLFWQPFPLCVAPKLKTFQVCNNTNLFPHYLIIDVLKLFRSGNY